MSLATDTQPQVIPPDQAAKIAQEQGTPLPQGQIAPAIPNRGKQIASEVNQSGWIDDPRYAAPANNATSSTSQDGWIDDPRFAAPAKTPEPAEKPSVLKEAGKSFWQGDVSGTNHLIGGVLKFMGDMSDSNTLKDSGQWFINNADDYLKEQTPATTEGMGLPSKVLVKGAGMAGGMLPLIASAPALAPLGVLGGGVAIATPYAMQAYEDTLSEMKQAPPDVAKKAATISGVLNFVTFAAMGPAMKVLGGGLGGVTAEGIDKNLLETGVVKPLLHDTAIAQGVAIPAMAIQGGGQQAITNEYNPNEATHGSVVGAAVESMEAATGFAILSLPGGLVARVHNANQANKFNQILSKPETDVDQRTGATALIMGQMAQVNPDAAKAWGQQASIAIAQKEPILLPGMTPEATKEAIKTADITPQTPLDQARADAAVLKTGQQIPDADEGRIKRATLVSLYGENKAVQNAILHGSDELVDQMLKVAPKIDQVKQARSAQQTQQANAETVLAKIQAAKEIPEEKQTPMQAAMAKAKIETPITPIEAPINKGDQIKAEKAAVQAKIAEASKAAAHSPENNRPLPTEAQKAEGNYAKGHLTLNGLDISIENPKGSVRSGVDAEGKPWQVKMQNAYGYIKRTEGGDGEHQDVYLGDHITKDQPVYVVDQIDPKTGLFNEHKSVLGARGYAEAKEIYDNHFSDKSGPSRRGAITKMAPDEFKTWLKGDTTGPVKYKEPSLPRVNAEEGTGILNAVVQGMQRQSGERRIAGEKPLEGLAEDRRVAAAMQRREQQDLTTKGTTNEETAKTKSIESNTEATQTTKSEAIAATTPVVATGKPETNTGSERNYGATGIEREIKTLSNGRLVAVGFPREQLIKAGIDERSIDAKGQGAFPANTNKIQLERALGISKIPEDTILAKGDKPFAKRGEAVAYRDENNLKKTHEIIKIEDGYGIAPKTIEAKTEKPSIISEKDIPKSLTIEVDTDQGKQNVNALKAMRSANQLVERLERLLECVG